jgi:hypothetical protein
MNLILLKLKLSNIKLWKTRTLILTNARDEYECEECSKIKKREFWFGHILRI